MVPVPLDGTLAALEAMETAVVSDDLADLNLVDLENELCRLPGVIMTRFVKGRMARPLGATLFVVAGTPAKQLRTNVAAVASVHFDIQLDPLRMVIVEVEQMSVVTPGDAPAVSAGSHLHTGTDAGGGDNYQALESAHQAVSALWEKLKNVTPGEDDTVVVTDSETVETGPSRRD